LRLSTKLKSGKSSRVVATTAGAGKWGRPERAFLVGIEYPTRVRASGSERLGADTAEYYERA